MAPVKEPELQYDCRKPISFQDATTAAKAQPGMIQKALAAYHAYHGKERPSTADADARLTFAYFGRDPKADAIAACGPGYLPATMTLVKRVRGHTF